MPLKPSATRQFKRDFKRIRKRGWNLGRLTEVMEKLANQEQLAREYKAHPLKGKLKGHWECHLEPDFLLLWYTTDDEIVFVRTGTHADLFGE